MKYREEKEITKIYKRNYIDGINGLIEKRQKEAERIRNEYAKNIFDNQGKYRDELKRMFGWPLTVESECSFPDCTVKKLSDEEGYSIYRMEFEILEGLKMTGLFFRINSEEKKPLVIVQHGGQGTPEHIAGFYGSDTNYNGMLERVLKHKVNVFAPQLLLWSDDYNVEANRSQIDARLKRIGGSVTALELYGIGRILDYFEIRENISSFGMVGLSYGGFYTLCMSAIDTRIKSSISCSFFNTRDKIGWSDWTWFKSAEMFDDAEIACLVYPRKLCIEIGNRDELFDYKYGVETFEKLKKMCESVGTDWIEFIVFDGGHEFCKNDRPIESLIDDLVNGTVFN